MSRLQEYFMITNNGLNNANLSGCMQSGILLAESLGKGEIAYSEISQLPPGASFNKPDANLDAIIEFCEQQIMMKQNDMSLGRTK